MIWKSKIKFLPPIGATRIKTIFALFPRKCPEFGFVYWLEKIDLYQKYIQYLFYSDWTTITIRKHYDK
jgi:hypothetical protein